MLAELSQKAIMANPELTGMAAVVEKEILHLDILSLLGAEGYLEQLTFIGGTALRLCYNSSRLSEDLDFTGGCNFSPGDFAGLAERLETFLQNKYQVPVVATEPKLDKGDTSTWKVTLQTRGKRRDLPGQRLHIDICAYDSLQPTVRPVRSHYGIESAFASLPIPVQTREEILADKMLALILRGNRIKPRDLWDIAWLRQENVQRSPEMVRAKLDMRDISLADYRTELARKLAWLTPDNETVRQDFTHEMSRFLPTSIRNTSIDHPEFWNYLCETVVQECNHLDAALSGRIQSKPEHGFRM